MSRNLDDLNKQIDCLQFVIVILMSQLKKIGGSSPALDYAEKIMASQGNKGVVVSKQSTGQTEGEQ